jgi:hypothetical protein
MHCETVDINRAIRRMRGRSQAYLVEGNDGRFYVAKFAGNPQGNRTLINEWITAHLLKRLDVSTPLLIVLRLKGQGSKAALNREWKPGDTIELDLPMPPILRSLADRDRGLSHSTKTQPFQVTEYPQPTS